LYDQNFELSLKDVVAMHTHAAIECVLGIGLNPFLRASHHGRLFAPDGEVFELNISEACYRWPNLTCMVGSQASGWGVAKTTSTTDTEFIRETINCATQMQAQGAGMVLLLASVVTGTTHDRLREILLRAFADDEKWKAMSAWTKWRTKDPLKLSDQDRKKAVVDAGLWTDVWNTLAADVVKELYPPEKGDTMDALRLYSKYGALLKRKVTSVDAALLEEIELYSVLKVSGVIVPWTHRRETRNGILKIFYGSLVVSILSQLDSAEDCEEWDKAFKRHRGALDPFVTAESTRAQGAGTTTGSRGKQLNRIEARRERERKFEKKLKDAAEQSKPTPAVVQASQNTGGFQCYKCGGPHLKRECPQLDQQRVGDLPRRSPRLAENAANGKGGIRPQNKGLAMLGQVTKPGDSDESDFEDPDEGRSSKEIEFQDPEDGTDDDRQEESKSGMLLYGPSFQSKVRTVDLVCNGRLCKFVIDGGADLSLITRKHVSENSVVKRINVTLEGLAGKVAIKEALECNFSFGKRNLGIINFLPGKVDGLLGIDLIDEIDIPAVVKFRKAYDTLKNDLENPNEHPKDGTWTPLFEFSEGPLNEDQLRQSVAELRLPIMDCSFDAIHPTIRERGRPTPFRWREKAEEMVKEFVRDGVMKEVDPHSEGWYSPGIFIPKISEQDELKLRFVIDYKTVNKRVVKTHTAPYPHTASTLISSVGRSAAWFSTVDIKNAFFNLPLADGVKPFLRTSVVVDGRHRIFEMQKGPQGFSETPIWWISFIEEVIRALRKILRPLYGKLFDIRAYVDDLLVFADSQETCQRVHDSLLQYLRCLGIPYGKVIEPREEVEVIGLVFSSRGVRIARTDSMAVLSPPSDKVQLRTALGVFQYVRKAYNTRDFVESVGVLSKLLRKTVTYVWDEAAQRAWKQLVDGFQDVYYAFFSTEDRLSDNECFIVQTDASDLGMAAVLWLADERPDSTAGPEWFNQHAKLINTRCRTFNQEELKYPTWDKEALSIFESLNEFSVMLLTAISAEGQLLVMSDSNAALQRWKNILNGGVLDEKCAAGPRARRWTRWVDDLSIVLDLKPIFVHIKGENNQVADYFSRALHQIRGVGTEPDRKLCMIGTIGTLDEMSISPADPFMSELLVRVRQLAYDESNSDEYQGRLIRDILVAEDESTAFRVVNGLPYMCATGSQPRLYIPKGRASLGGEEVDIRTALIALAHGTHEGITRTTNGLKGYYWPKMTQTVTAFVKSCDHCQKKNIKANYGRITGRAIARRFERIVIDHATPSTVGANSGGKLFRHVLVIVDSFTRYVRMIPVFTMDTTETVDHLLRWALDFGFPREIVSDNASALRNSLIERALSITSRADPGIHRWISPVKYPQAQGEAERVIRELKSYINVRNDEDWPLTLPFLSFAHNSAVYGASGISPHMMVYGEEPTRLVDLAAWPYNDPIPDSAAEYLECLKGRLKDFHELYEMKTEEYRSGSRDYYNKTHPLIEFSEGDRVWIVHVNHFKTDVTGPATVERRLGDHMYMVDGKMYPLQHLVPYVSSNEIDRTGISFAETVDDNQSVIRELRRIESRQLKAGDLILVQRGRTSQDVYEYDVAKVVENFVVTETILVDLMNVDDSGRRWRCTGLRFTFSYQAILASGFKLTRNNELRSSTLRSWRAVGLVD